MSNLPNQNITEALLSAMLNQQVINTHCHHLPDEQFDGFDLEILLRNSYVSWCGVDWDRTVEGRRNLLEKVHFHASFVWLEKSLRELYNLEPLTVSNWIEYNNTISQAHRDPAYHLDILQNRCRYACCIQDAYWNPGSNNGHADLFQPTFRVNAFFFGYRVDVTDHDGNNPYQLYNHPLITDLNEYTTWVADIIAGAKARGCIALKIPIAYDRSLDFSEVSTSRARQAFFNCQHHPNLEDVKDFQDYLLFHICDIASELNLPIQVHTGTGQGRRTNALWLQEAIEKNPHTRFVLLHCSYPWVEDTVVLVRKYPNVYPDLSMLPLFSSQASRYILNELIEGATTDRLFWGCDTWTPEESYGSLLAFRQVLIKVLTEKITDKYLSLQDAIQITKNILYTNAASLYRIYIPEVPKNENPLTPE